MTNSKDIISLPPDETFPSDHPQKGCDFLLTSKLGEGAFGLVRLGKNIQTGEEVAVKILEKIRILQLEVKTRVEREIKILKSLRHSNIVQLYSVIQTEHAMYLIMEYIAGKELFDYIHNKKKLSEPEACRFYQQIISGVEYLHKLGIVHRDIKPENLLLDERSKEIKIVDFGLSNLYYNYKDQMLKTPCGSPCYAAPEMLSGKEYKAAPVDIWATGIVLYAMLCGFLPFDDSSNTELYKKICNGKYTAIPNEISGQAKDLIRRILTTDPKRRINIYQIKHHAWFNLINPNLNINEGLLINKVVIPVDEEVVDEMVNKYGFNSKEDIRANILSNRHNSTATIYYLILKQKVKAGKKSVADLKSELFVNYIKKGENLFHRYNYDFDKVINSRKYGIEESEYINSNGGIKKREGRSVESVSTRPSEKVSPISKGVLGKGISSDKFKGKNDINLKLHINRKKINNGNNCVNIKEKFKYNIKMIKGIFINTKLSFKPKETQSKMQMNIKAKTPYNPQCQKMKRIFSPSSKGKQNFTISIYGNNKIEKKKTKSPANAHIKSNTSPIIRSKLKGIYKVKNETPNAKRDIYTPWDLSCITFKDNIKELLIAVMNKLKLSYWYQNNRFIIESLRNEVKIEIYIQKIKESQCYYILKFIRVLGSILTYWRISREILSKLEL